MGLWGHARHVTGPEAIRGPGASARLLATARRHAGLSQAELSRRTEISRPAINRIERGRAVPRVDLLLALLHGCGSSLATVPRRGANVDRGPIRDLLSVGASHRITGVQRRVLRILAAHAVRYVVVGSTAARLNGAPLPAPLLEVLVHPEERNTAKLDMAGRRRPSAGTTASGERRGSST